MNNSGNKGILENSTQKEVLYSEQPNSSSLQHNSNGVTHIPNVPIKTINTMKNNRNK